MATTPTAAELYVDPYPGRKGSERITLACGCGDGMYKGFTRIFDAIGNPYCFDCGGTGTYSFLVSSARAKARRQAKRRAEALAMPDRRAEWEEAHPDAAAAIKTYRMRSEFIMDMGARLDECGELTEKQEAAVLRAAERFATEDAAPKIEVPAGRHTVEGVIVSASLRDSPHPYGQSTWKVLVQADGYKVWGTAPRQLVDDAMDIPGQAVSDYLKGARVRFTATLEPKAGEAGFGFFKRPTKTEVLELSA
ncbi:hypothetical protein CLV30_12885 [Haloactinopolyspora alba]|uniref:Uncharacterized protein n=1 Tax=Haloactinopolyspora alba TaxID=648780 RepID=A0A2P8DF32_9ACTN|nr:hypothetical protein [Haloactinopolyspora alba]PSK95833.1 hypothetical protein CLV30_12885 [Haloactinopolyspora alba]